MADLKIIDLQTGATIKDVSTAPKSLVDGQALLDPTCQEYDPKRQIIRSKTPDLTGSLAARVDRLEFDNEQLKAALQRIQDRLGMQ